MLTCLTAKHYFSYVRSPVSLVISISVDVVLFTLDKKIHYETRLIEYRITFSIHQILDKCSQINVEPTRINEKKTYTYIYIVSLLFIFVRVFIAFFLQRLGLCVCERNEKNKKH